MIKNKTYNNAINTLKNVGNYHYQISTVSTGDIWDINTEKSELFPIMHINPVNVETGLSQLNFNFQIFIMDLVSEDENWTEGNFQSAANLSNEQEVLSECLEISVDVISMLRQGMAQSSIAVNNIDDPSYFAEGEYTLEPFSERFDNLCTGWVFTIKLVAQNDFQSCVIPALDMGAGE